MCSLSFSSLSPSYAIHACVWCLCLLLDQQSLSSLASLTLFALSNVSVCLLTDQLNNNMALSPHTYDLFLEQIKLSHQREILLLNELNRLRGGNDPLLTNDNTDHMSSENNVFKRGHVSILNDSKISPSKTHINVSQLEINTPAKGNETKSVPSSLTKEKLNKINEEMGGEKKKKKRGHHKRGESSPLSSRSNSPNSPRSISSISPIKTSVPAGFKSGVDANTQIQPPSQPLPSAVFPHMTNTPFAQPLPPVFLNNETYISENGEMVRIMYDPLGQQTLRKSKFNTMRGTSTKKSSTEKGGTSRKASKSNTLRKGKSNAYYLIPYYYPPTSTPAGGGVPSSAPGVFPSSGVPNYPLPAQSQHQQQQHPQATPFPPQNLNNVYGSSYLTPSGGYQNVSILPPYQHPASPFPGLHDVISPIAQRTVKMTN